MANPNLDNSITFDGVTPDVIKKTPIIDDGDETKVVGSDIGERLRHTEATESVEIEEEVPYTKEPTSEIYEGPGLVIDTAELKTNDENFPKYTGITPDTQSNIDKYLAETMESDLAEFKAMKEAKEAEDAEKTIHSEVTQNDEESKIETDDNFAEKYESATVIIDKSGFGNVINFTDDEREKLEKARRIRVEEVETLSISTLKTKKAKKQEDFNRVLKKKADFNSTNIVLPISGYTATISGCSAYELISLIEPVDNNPLMKTQNKWSVIHSKIESTSIGKMDFDTFLQNTAANDYDTFIYGILCSTYPDDDSLELSCEKCKKIFKHQYSVRSLIRVEKMSEELQNTVMKIVDASAFENTAKQAHAEAPISMVKRIKLPMSEIIVDIYVQSAYDLIKKRATDLSELKEEKYQAAAILSTLIRSAYVYDESDDTYFELDDSIELAKMVYSLSEVDVMVINRIADDMLTGKSIEFGLMDINCPHCGAHTDTIEIGLDDLLFQRYRQAINTTVE